METKNHLKAHSQMLIRKPVSEVFEALVSPDITSKFWFTKSSGRLESGKDVEWEWGQFGVSATINVTEIKPNELIRFQWPSDTEENGFRTVDISFKSTSKNTTFVQVVEKGFDENDDHIIEQIAGQTGGWALVLSAMKAWLEHQIDLNLINDHNPL